MSEQEISGDAVTEEVAATPITLATVKLPVDELAADTVPITIPSEEPAPIESADFISPSEFLAENHTAANLPLDYIPVYLPPHPELPLTKTSPDYTYFAGEDKEFYCGDGFAKVVKGEKLSRFVAHHMMTQGFKVEEE